MSKKIWLFHETDDHYYDLIPLLEAQDYHIIPVRVNEANLYLPAHSHSDLILFDPSVSRRNIFELCRMLKKSWWVRSVPVIVYSQDCQPNWVRQAYALGVDYYVFKEVDGADGEQLLLSLLETLFLRQRHPYRLLQTSQFVTE